MELFEGELGKFVLDVAILNTIIKTGETLSKEQETKCKILKYLISAYNKLLDKIDISGDDVFSSTNATQSDCKNDNSTSIDESVNVDDSHEFSLYNINDYYTNNTKSGITLGAAPVPSTSNATSNTTSKVEESTTTDEERDEQISNLTQYYKNQAEIFIRSRWVNYDEVIDNFCKVEEKIKDTEDIKDDISTHDSEYSSFDTDSVGDDSFKDDSFKDKSELIDFTQFTKMNDISDGLMDDSVIENIENKLHMIPIIGPTLDENDQNIKLVYEITHNSLGYSVPDNRKLLISDNSDCSESTLDDSYDGSGDDEFDTVELIENSSGNDTLGDSTYSNDGLVSLPYISV